MTPPTCENPTCSNNSAKSKNGQGWLRYCCRRCQNQHSSTKGSEKRKLTCIQKYGAITNLTTAGTKQKIESTLIEKYGVVHPMKSSEIKQKLADTKEERYGDPTFNNAAKIKQTWNSKDSATMNAIQAKREDTTEEKYGTKYFFQTDAFRELFTETSMAQYGVDNPAKSDKVKQKISNTQVSTYGKLFNQQHISDETLAKLSDTQFLKENAHRFLYEIAAELGVSYHTVKYAYDKFQIEKVQPVAYRSAGEVELCEFITGTGTEIRTCVRGILGGNKEIDIYVPSLGLAFEYDGLYWHTELAGKGKHYHRDKTSQCAEKGITLIHITDLEWNTKKDVVKSRILNLLKKTPTRIFARKTRVLEISSKEADIFMDEHHIQGSCVSGARFGLFVDGEIVAAITLSKARFSKTAECELLRFATTKNHTVVGGASKLFAAFIAIHNPSSVVSYADKRWSTGNLYKQMGFTFQHDSEPNYWYTWQHKTFEHRIRYQKHKLHAILEKFDDNLSEWENMSANGFDRYWDCGNSVWVWNKSS